MAFSTLSRRIRLGAGLCAVALGLSACGAAPDRSESGGADEGRSGTEIELVDGYDPEGHLNYAFSVMTPGWDPIASVSGYDFVTLAPVYDRLVYLAPDGSLEPMLATEWKSTDNGTGIELKLRDDVTFSDGTPFNAEAVKINLDRAKGEGSRIAAEIAQLDSVEVIDEYTVKLTADTGAGALLGALGQRPGMMASPTAIAAGTLLQTAAGAGPYTVTNFAPADVAEYAKRDGYWDPDAQRVATMRIKLMTDDQTRLNALQSGEIDGARIQAFQVNAANGSGLTVISQPSVIFLYLTVNSAKAPYDNPKVIEAINYAIDRNAIAEGFFEGLCAPGIQPWPESSYAYDPEIGDGSDIWPYDPEKAKELIAEAGVSTPIEMPTVTTNVTYTTQLSEVLQAQLAEVGITMTIDPVPTPQVIENFSVAKSVAANVNPFSGSADPHGVASRHLLPGAIYNVGNPVDQSILDLAQQASTPLEPDDRAPLYHDMMQAMIDHPTHLMPICHQHIIDAWNDKVSGVTSTSAGFIDLRGAAVAGG